MGFICGAPQEVGLGTTYGSYQFEFNKGNIEEEYKVDEILEFVGKDKFKTQSGKEVDVFKYKSKTYTGMEYEKGKELVLEREFWSSPQVPTYYVYGKAVDGPVLLFEGTLLDFGLEGAKISVTQRDIEKCMEGEAIPSIPDMPQIPELPQAPSQANKRYCQTNDDCVCGIDKETGECAVGNKTYIDTSKQCPDFCTGFGGQFKIVCKDNQCLQVLR